MSDDLKLPESPSELGRDLLKLLDAMAQASDPDVKRLRPELVAFLNGLDEIYAKEGAEAAKKAAAEGMPMFEAQASGILLKNTRRMREQLVQQSKKLGTASPQGKQIREAAEVISELNETLEMMMAAAQKGDQELRAAAQERMNRLHKKLDTLG